MPIELIFFKNCYLWQESRVWKWLLLPQLGSRDLKLTFFLIPFLVKHRTLVSMPDIASLGERKAIFPSHRILGSFSLLSSLRKSTSLWENACCMSSLQSWICSFCNWHLNNYPQLKASVKMIIQFSDHCPSLGEMIEGKYAPVSELWCETPDSLCS